MTSFQLFVIQAERHSQLVGLLDEASHVLLRLRDGCAAGLDAFDGNGNLVLLRENLVEFFLCAGHRLVASAEETITRHPSVVVAAIAPSPRLLRLRAKYLPHPLVDVFAQRANLLPDVVNLAL